MQHKGDQFAEAMHELRRGYVRDLWQREEILLDALTKLEDTGLSAADREELESLAHKFVGTGRTYQFPALSKAGREVETLVQNGGAADTDVSALKSAILDLLDACADARGLFDRQDKDRNTANGADAQSTDQASPQATAKELPSPRDLPAVLIVDDDRATRELLAQFISQYATCSMAENSGQAEKLLAQQPFDLVLLDHNMPGAKSGLALLKSIKANETLRHLDVVMITASGEPQMVLDALTVGASDYVLKPFDAQTVATKLKTRLSHLRRTILVVDDDPAVQKLLKAKFRSLGVKCVVYEDGLQALHDMGEINPDLVILDRILPGVEGMAVLHKMRQSEEFQHIPVVMLSAKREDQDIMSGLKLGAADYIVKPFNLDELVLRCERLLAGGAPDQRSNTNTSRAADA